MQLMWGQGRVLPGWDRVRVWKKWASVWMPEGEGMLLRQEGHDLDWRMARRRHFWQYRAAQDPQCDGMSMIS